MSRVAKFFLGWAIILTCVVVATLETIYNTVKETL